MTMRSIIHSYPNGLRLVVVPQYQSPSVTVGVLVGVGTNYETFSQNGISHFLEHMCFKGTSKRPTPLIISSELENMGASYNAFTTRDMTGYWAKVATVDAEKALDVVADMYLDPVFPEEELEREKGVIIEEMNMYEDIPRARVEDELESILYGNQPAGWSVLGRKEVIRGITKGDFLSYRNRYYTAPNTVVFIAGNITLARAKSLVNRSFASITTTKSPRYARVTEHKTNNPVSVVHRPLDQTHIALGVRAFPAGDANSATLDVLSTILGGGMSSRLFIRIREQMGAAYYVRSTPVQYASHGFLSVSAGVSNDRLIDSIKAIGEEMNAISSHGPSREEFVRAQRSLRGKFLLSLETSDEAGFFFAEELMRVGKTKTIVGYVKELMAVTPRDVQRLAKKLFVNNRLRCAVLGPHKITTALRRACCL